MARQFHNPAEDTLLSVIGVVETRLSGEEEIGVHRLLCVQMHGYRGKLECSCFRQLRKFRDSSQARADSAAPS